MGRAWLEWNPETEKWQMVLNQDYDLIYCEECPCSKCLKLDYIVLWVRDFSTTGVPGSQEPPRERWFRLTNGEETVILTNYAWALANFSGKLHIKVTCPDPICEREELIRIQHFWIVDELPPNVNQVANAGGGTCRYEPQVGYQNFDYPSGEVIHQTMRVSSCGCNCFEIGCLPPDPSPTPCGEAYAGEHLFGNIILGPGGVTGSGPENVFSTAVQFKLWYCYCTPCTETPPDPIDPDPVPSIPVDDGLDEEFVGLEDEYYNDVDGLDKEFNL
jgi:hypothetical protein